jgi:hypothetical protein
LSRLAIPAFVHERERDFRVGLEKVDWRQVVSSRDGLDFDDGSFPLISRYESKERGKNFARSQLGWAARKLGKRVGSFARPR